MNLQLSNTVIDKIIQMKDSLPRKQRHLCDYILKNHDKIGLYTIKDLAKNADVGISTIVRTVNALGYENFNELKKELHEESYPSKWTLKKSLEEISKENRENSTLIQVWDESINLLNKSLNPSLMENFSEAVKMIMTSSFINVLGTRPYRATALYFEQVLGEFYAKIRQLSHDTDTVYDKILQMEKDEILLVFAFEPYTNSVINAVKLAHELGNKVILITDHILVP